MKQHTPRVATGALAIALAVTLAAAPAAYSGGLTQAGAQVGTTPASKPAPDSDGVTLPDSFPYQPDLRVFPHDENDASYAGDLVGHTDIAPKLNELMSASDRVSAQVIGQSTEGRDLYLVTLTAPESKSETKQQTRWREQIQNDPAKAATNKHLQRDYKTPIWFSANIHGNEWEGTDAILRYLEEMASSDSPEVAELLANHRIYFSVSLNPDGRNLGQRRTVLDFDANRDMITNITPEATSYVQTTQELLALYASDIHGYTSVLQVEPTGPPHGENYEYDLYIPHNYALARQIEKDVVAADIPGNPLYTSGDAEGIKIPYRDTPSGWDDYPPIFTAQYAAFYGALTATVELPLGRVAGGVQTPERAQVNSDVALQVIHSSVDYLTQHDKEILANQIETFRRGVDGEEKVSLTEDNIAGVPGPDEWKPLWDPTDNQDPVELPRAYVIPAGDAQRSASDANRLVEQLLFHAVQVQVMNAPKTIGGTTYPAGSYVVDMHQPKKGLANVLLDLGSDISQRIPSMYDISAWSYSYLWGATVDKVGEIGDAPVRGTRAIDAPVAQADAPKKAQYLAFEVAGVPDYAALNSLLAADADAWLTADGAAVIAPGDYDQAVNAAVEFDIAFRPATEGELAEVTADDAKQLDEITVGFTGGGEVEQSLAELGFEATRVSASGIASDPSVLTDLDALWIGSSLSFSGSQQAGKEAVAEWLAEGNALVGSGAAAFSAASDFGLVSADLIAGNRSGNGIVAVDTPTDSILASYAQDYAFIYPAYSFTGLGAGTSAEQFYAEGNPLLAGHWTGTNDSNGPEGAAGNASVISGESSDGKAVVFGTSPFFRTHPKGGMSQAAQAIFWGS